MSLIQVKEKICPSCGSSNVQIIDKDGDFLYTKCLDCLQRFLLFDNPETIIE
jgi:ribosomal protein S27E